MLRTIVLPDADNKGVSLSREHADFAALLLQVAGGYSVTSQRGAWRGDDGFLYTDESQAYSVNVDDETDARLVALLPGVCAMFRQVSLYTTACPCVATFVAPVVVTQTVKVG